MNKKKDLACIAWRNPADKDRILELLNDNVLSSLMPEEIRGDSGKMTKWAIEKLYNLKVEEMEKQHMKNFDAGYFFMDIVRNTIITNKALDEWYSALYSYLNEYVNFRFKSLPKEMEARYLPDGGLCCRLKFQGATFSFDELALFSIDIEKNINDVKVTFIDRDIFTLYWEYHV